jgi:hypothetical protein
VTGRLPRGVSGKQAVSALERAGFVAVRTTRSCGSRRRSGSGTIWWPADAEAG